MVGGNRGKDNQCCLADEELMLPIQLIKKEVEHA